LRKYGNVPQGYLQPLAAVALTGMLSQFFSAPPAEKQNLAPDLISTIESAAQEAQKEIGAKLSSKMEMTETKLHVTHLSVVWFRWRMSYRVLTSLLLE